MLKSLRIRNYRVFKDLEISGLYRINLIGGRNNAGKTSLLEAIFLLAGGRNPHLAVNANVMRMTGPDPIVAIPQALETTWKQMFHSLDTGIPISIEGCHEVHGPLALKVSLEPWQGTESLPPASFGGDSPSEVPVGHSLTFRYKGSPSDDSLGQIRFRPTGAGGSVDVNQPGVPNSLEARIILSRSGNIQEDATLLGKLRTQKRGDLLLDALRMIEPNLESVEDSFASGVPMIWGDVGLSELVPLPVMGEGMTRLTRVVLGISAVPGGVLLVDEIENGIHHSVMSKVWKAVSTAAKQFDVQVFATTHSYECFEQAYNGLGEDGFRLHRLEKSQDGEIVSNRSVTYGSEAIAASIEYNFEVR